MYNPKPLDTSDIKLSEELNLIIEKLAENVHDIWAKNRISEGWVFGEKHDAKSKTTPFLVPYANLPESEKNYDRNTAMETIKMIIKCGYKIDKQ